MAPEWKALLARDPLHFEHTVQDEAAGLPWAKAKIQVCSLLPLCLSPSQAQVMSETQLPAWRHASD